MHFRKQTNEFDERKESLKDGFDLSFFIRVDSVPFADRLRPDLTTNITSPARALNGLFVIRVKLGTNRTRRLRDLV
jgi:hypothetical protein